MESTFDKIKNWHKETDHSWKVAVIEKCRKEGIMYIDPHEDIDYLYENCIEHLFEKSTQRITNLAKKLGLTELPCTHCQNIIKFWDFNKQYRWSPDTAHLFKENTKYT